MVTREQWKELILAMQLAKWALLHRGNDPKSRLWRWRVRAALNGLEKARNGFL